MSNFLKRSQRPTSEPEFDDDSYQHQAEAYIPDYNPVTSLDNLSIKDELLFAFNTAKRLSVQSSSEDSLSQRAQAVNTLARVLADITSLQERVHNVDRLKEIESALVKTLQNHPEVRQAFLEEYKNTLIA